MSMSFVFVGNGWVESTGTPNVTIAYPVGIQKNDLIALWLSYKAGSTITLAGYTELGFVFQTNTRLSLYGKVADGTESGNLSITVTGGDVSTAALAAFRAPGFPSQLVIALKFQNYNAGSNASSITYTDPSPNNSYSPPGGAAWLCAAVGRNTTAARSGTISGVGWVSFANVTVASGGTFVDMVYGMHGALSYNPNDPTCTFNGTQTDLVIAIAHVYEFPNATPPTNTYDPWRPPSFDQPTSFTQQQMNQLRANVFASYIANPTPFGWDYLPDPVVSNEFFGSKDLPARKFYYHGQKAWDGTYLNNTKIIKQVMVYKKSIVTEVSYFFSQNNGSSFVPLTDDLGRNTVQSSVYPNNIVAQQLWTFRGE